MVDRVEFQKLVSKDFATKDIPKRIHRMWLDKNSKTNTKVPQKYITNGYIQSWKTHNPEFEHVFWNVQKVSELFQHPKLARWKNFYFNKLKVWIQKCDFARYALLYIHGGIYVDLDFVCFRNATELVTNRQIGLVFEPLEHSVPIIEPRAKLQNGIMASIPNHPFWEVVMDHIMSIHSPTISSTMYTTGPCMLAKLEKKLAIQKTFPEWFWDPCKVLPVDDRKGIRSDCPINALDTAVCVTFWKEGTGWGRKKTKLSNKNFSQASGQHETVSANSHRYRKRSRYMDTASVYIILLLALHLVILCVMIFITVRSAKRLYQYESSQ